MTSTTLPAPVLRWRRHPLRWLFGAIVVIGVIFAIMGTTTPRGDSVSVAATIVRRNETNGSAIVRYRVPGNDEQAQTPLWLDGDPGDRVQVLVYPDDPDAGAFLYAPGVWSSDNWGVLAVLAPFVLWWVARRWTVRRVRRRMAADEPQFRLTGTPTTIRGRRGPGLALHSLDAAPGDRPLCVVPLVSWPLSPVGDPLTVEVKGTPRPGRLVVVRIHGIVQWSAGRSLPARLPRAAMSDVPVPRPWVPALLVALVMVPFVWAGIAGELSAGRRQDRVEAHGRRVEATVQRGGDSVTLVAEYRVPGERDQFVTQLESPLDRDLKPGDKIALKVSRTDPTEAYVAGQPYDSAAFVYVAALLLAPAIVWGVASLRAQRTGAGGARRGPGASRYRFVRGPSFLTTRLCVVDGQLWFRSSWARGGSSPTLRFDPAGLVRVSGEWAQVIAWDELEIHFARVRTNMSWAKGRRSGTNWSLGLPNMSYAEMTRVENLCRSLAGHPERAAGLADPMRVAWMLGALSLPVWWNKRPRPWPWFRKGKAVRAAVERELENRGVEVLGNHVVEDPSLPTAEEVGRHAWLRLDPTVRSDVSERRVIATARWFLERPRWPFALLEVELPGEVAQVS